MNKKIGTNVFVHNLLIARRGRILSQSKINYCEATTNQLSNDNLDNVLTEDVLASVSLKCSSSVIVSVE